MMRRVDPATGLVVALIGAYALVRALDLQLTVQNGVPGPGLFPALTSGLLLVLGLLLVATVLRRRRRPDDGVDRVPEQGQEDVGRSELRRVGLVGIGFIASVVLLPTLGFLLTGVLLVGYLVLGLERRRGIGSLAAVVLIPGLAYVVFVTLLGVRLPEGILAQL